MTIVLLNPAPISPAAAARTRRRRVLIWQTILCIAIFLAALAPVLSRPQFGGDSEDLVVQTALQMRNGGPWWVPVLGFEPRLKKPPLPTWIAALTARPRTVSLLSSAIPTVRDQAYRDLAWQLRWPALLAACLTLAAVAWLARMTSGPAHVIPSVLICASTVLFLRFVRSITPDVHLLLWVTLANACFTAMILENRRWLGAIGGGAALGLALMSKGPPALVQTLIPLAIFLLLRSRSSTGLHTPRPINRHTSTGVAASAATAPARCASSTPSSLALRLTTAALVTLAIALPWPIGVYLQNHDAIKIWIGEMGADPTSTAYHDHCYAYAIHLLNLFPWLPLVIAGALLAWKPMLRGRRRGWPLLLALAPLIVFECFPDRKNRYLLPLVGPFAILAADAALRLLRARKPLPPIGKALWICTWAIPIAAALGLPVLGAWKLHRIDGTHWFGLPLATVALIIAAMLIVGGLARFRASRNRPIIAIALLMFLCNTLFLYGWSGDVSGVSEMKPVADRLRAILPGAAVAYYDPVPRDKPVTVDLDIYLDRPVPDLPQWPANDGHWQAVVALRNDNDPEPSAPGWRKLFDLQSRKHHWYVLTPSLDAAHSARFYQTTSPR